MESMIQVKDAALQMENPGLGFERIELLPGSSFRDSSTVIIIPTRGTVHYKVIQALMNLIPYMNQKRAVLWAVGHEVGRAYNEMIQFILSNPELSKWKYIMTCEDDNLPPPDAHIKLVETLERGGFDAVSGIYFTKGDMNMPQCYGNSNEFRQTGVLDFRPRDIRECLASGGVLECNGIAMGCAVWKMDFFRDIPAPWFVTEQSWDPIKGIKVYTQDISACEKAKRVGKRFAVDMNIKVGHLDISTGIVY